MSPEQQAEWNAWQNIVKRWPGEINDPTFKPVIEAIRLWGERLAQLRRTRPLDEAQRAMIAAIKRFDAVPFENRSIHRADVDPHED